MPNGDDDMGGVIGSGTDEGGGMYTEPGPPPEPDDDDDLSNRKIKRRTRRARFRSTRQARKTGRRK